MRAAGVSFEDGTSIGLSTNRFTAAVDGDSVDPGQHKAKMAVGIVQIRNAQVDHAPAGCVEKCSAGNGGNDGGDKPEKHGPWTLDAGTRQGSVIYKPNAAKNHRNTHR